MIRKYLAVVECPDEPGEPYGVTILGFPSAAITTMADRAADVRHQAELALASAIEDLRHRGEPLPPSLDQGEWPTYDPAEYDNPLDVVIEYRPEVAQAA